MIGDLVRKWFVHFHGEGEEHQFDLYRCLVCRRLVTHNKIRKGKICCSGRVSPSTPSFFEIVKLFVFPWSV